MHSNIVKSALKKIKEIAEKNGGVKISTTKASEDLSIILKQDYQVAFSDKSLRDVSNEKTLLKQAKVLDALCKFLGYENYADYLDKNPSKNNTFRNTNNSSNFINKYKTSLIVGVIIVLLLSTIILSIKKQRWMVWDTNHYTEVDFNTKKYSVDELKLYKEERITLFKKIEATCEVEYFDKSGKPQIWYGKNSKKELEIFTSFGLHPETGQTLKPISEYMIKKYFCNNYHK